MHHSSLVLKDSISLEASLLIASPVLIPPGPIMKSHRKAHMKTKEGVSLNNPHSTSIDVQVDRHKAFTKRESQWFSFVRKGIVMYGETL